MEKSDILFLIIGTNPMPNLMAAVSRIKIGGKIVCIYTHGTEEIYENFKDEIMGMYLNQEGEDNINFDKNGIKVDRSHPEKIRKELIKKLPVLLDKSLTDGLVELNFTGGTKVISAISHEVFKNFCKEEKINCILSYIDSEKEEIYYEKINNDNETSFKFQKFSSLDDNVSLDLLKIVKLHNKSNGDKDFTSKSSKPYDEYLGEKIFKLFKDNDIEMREKAINFLTIMYCLKKKYKKKKEKKIGKDNFIRFVEDANEVLSSSANPFGDINVVEDFAIKNDKKLELELIESLGGLWFEDYVFKLLLELKEKKIIEEVVNSLKKNDRDNYEIDLVAYRRYKLFAISVTSIDTVDEAKSKLYEVKLRANQLGGAETGICYINLCKNSEEFEDMYRDIWDNEEPKNTLIICQDRFNDMKDRLEAWIKGEKYDA